MTAKEKAIKSIIADLKCTAEEAEEVYALEMKAKESGSAKIYAQSDEPKKRASREIKPDPQKIEIISAIVEQLEYCDMETGKPWDLKIVNPQKEITFRIGEDEYSVTLTKHRKKKGG